MKQVSSDEIKLRRSQSKTNIEDEVAMALNIPMEETPLC